MKKTIILDDFYGNCRKNWRNKNFSVDFSFIVQLANFMLKKPQTSASEFPYIWRMRAEKKYFKKGASSLVLEFPINAPNNQVIETIPNVSQKKLLPPVAEL